MVFTRTVYDKINPSSLFCRILALESLCYSFGQQDRGSTATWLDPWRVNSRSCLYGRNRIETHKSSLLISFHSGPYRKSYTSPTASRLTKILSPALRKELSLDSHDLDCQIWVEILKYSSASYFWNLKPKTICILQAFYLSSDTD